MQPLCWELTSFIGVIMNYEELTEVVIPHVFQGISTFPEITDEWWEE